MGLYQIKGSKVWHMSFSVNGIQVRKSTKRTDHYEATLVLNEAMTKAREFGPEAVSRRAPLLVEFAHEFNKWVNESQTLKPKTRKYYKSGLRLLGQTKLKDMRMSAITNDHCDTLVFPGENANANMALRTLRRMFSKAKERKVFFGEVPKIKLRQEWGRSIQMTEADAQLIASHMKDGDSKDAFWILRKTGMRPMETFGMRWEFVNFDEQYYANPRGKTSTSRRIVPLPELAMEILGRRHMFAGSPREGCVFPSVSKSGHLESIKWEFNRARDAAGLPSAMVLYTARHGRMSDLAQVLTLPEVMRIGGHSDSKTAMRYQHTSTAQLEAKLAEAKASGRIQ